MIAMHSLQVSSIVAEPPVAKLAMDCVAVTFESRFVVGSGFVTFKEGDTSRRRGKPRRPNDAYWPRCKAYDAYWPNGEYLYTFGDGEVVGPILDLQPCGVFLACCVRHKGRDVVVNLRRGPIPFAKPVFPHEMQSRHVQDSAGPCEKSKDQLLRKSKIVGCVCLVVYSLTSAAFVAGCV